MVRRPAEDAGVQIERVVIKGDLSSLSAAERAAYYRDVCQSIGLNPLSRPFDYLTLNGKLILYARKDATDQLRRLYGVSIVSLERETIGDMYVVTASARMPDGRMDSDVGAANIAGLRGDNLVNAMLKAITKAKRRVTLSICGLGWLDETEIETVPEARSTLVDPETGEILSSPAVKQETGLSPQLRKALADWHEECLRARANGIEPAERDFDNATVEELRESSQRLFKLRAAAEKAAWPELARFALETGIGFVPLPEMIGRKSFDHEIEALRERVEAEELERAASGAEGPAPEALRRKADPVDTDFGGEVTGDDEEVI
jgi:hypothetical protein